VTEAAHRDLFGAPRALVRNCQSQYVFDPDLGIRAQCRRYARHSVVQTAKSRRGEGMFRALSFVLAIGTVPGADAETAALAILHGTSQKLPATPLGQLPGAVVSA